MGGKGVRRAGRRPGERTPRLPAHQGGAPGEAGAEGREQDEIARLDAATPRAFVERDRNWSSNISRYAPLYEKLTGMAL